MPGHRKRTPFWVGGAAPGIRVVTALVMVDLVGPRETLPPQLSRLTFVRLEAVARVALARRGRMSCIVSAEWRMDILGILELHIYRLPYDTISEWWNFHADTNPEAEVVSSSNTKKTKATRKLKQRTAVHRS